MKRYLVANGADGKSDVLIDEELSMTEFIPGLSAGDIWVSFETPADNSKSDDPVEGFVHEPPDGGALFRVMKLDPERDRARSTDDAAEMHAKIGSVHVPDAEELAAAKHPSMHKTDTLNYFVIISGQMTMLTEGRDVVLHPGDVVVQQGCMHGWRNDGDEPAVLVGVLIDALPLS
jgi:mannose-6-phosphate isomerase-like protein (cupin superfamily)